MRRLKYKVSPWEMFISVCWLSLLLGPFLLTGALVFFVLTSPSDPMSPWWTVGIMLSAAAAFLGVVSMRGDRREKLARRLIEEDCARSDGTEVTIQGHNRDYVVFFTQGMTRKCRKCRVHLKDHTVEWLNAAAELNGPDVEDVDLLSEDVK